MMTKPRWNIILSSLNHGNCVALIGSGLSTTAINGELQNISQLLSHELVEKLKDEYQLEVQDFNNLPLSAQYFLDETKSPDYLQEAVVDFYQKRQQDIEHNGYPDTVFECLAALPISLFISTRHDNTLVHFLKAHGKKPIERAYDFTGNQQLTLGELGTVERPLVYRLLGSTDNQESLAVAESELLELLENIIADNPPLPKDLCDAFSAKSFLFLGCGLHSYYMRVLLHALGLNQSEKLSFAPNPLLFSKNKNKLQTSVCFYEVGYKTLNFLDIDEREFIQELFHRWQQKYPKNTIQSSTQGGDDDSANCPKVFVSYVREDSRFAQSLVEALNHRGIDPWLDKQKLRSGDNWEHVLEDVIGKEVDFFVVLLSKNLNDGVETYVHLEIERALKRKSKRGKLKFIFPLRIDEDMYLLDSIERAGIDVQTPKDFDTDVATLASNIKREFQKIQRRKL